MPEIVLRRRNNSDLFWYSLFVYATMIVDIYRKVNALILPLPISATSFRNLVYIGLFAINAWCLYRNCIRLINAVVAWVGGFCVCLLFSYLLNIEQTGIVGLMVNVLFMFFSRLLPAMFVAKAIVGRESEFIATICRMRIIPLLYIIVIFMRPETSEKAYITISSNLVIPVLLLFLASGNLWFKIMNWAIGAAGLVVIIIYGGRGSVVACLAAVVLYFFFSSFGKDSSQTRKIVIKLSGIVGVGVISLFYDQIVNWLLLLNPSSRTLKLLARGDFLWLSNRNKYYDAALESFIDHPFKVYGFLGDRYYFAESFGGGHTADMIETMFAHNVFYEWMLNFGVFIGLGIIIFFAAKVFQSSKLLLNDSQSVCFFATFFGVTFVSMLTSSSYLNDYLIWFVWGWMTEYTRISRKEFHQHIF